MEFRKNSSKLKERKVKKHVIEYMKEQKKHEIRYFLLLLWDKTSFLQYDKTGGLLNAFKSFYPLIHIFI